MRHFQIILKHYDLSGNVISVICLVFGFLTRFCTKPIDGFSGTQMVIIMKIISIAYDHEKRKSLPRFEEYLAYIFCPGTTVIGIWVSFPDFRKSLRKLKKNNESNSGKLCQTIGTFLNARWRLGILILKKKKSSNFVYILLQV